jgi:hypothetical protein
MFKARQRGSSSPSDTVAIKAQMPPAQSRENGQISCAPTGVELCGQMARPSRSPQNLLDRFDPWFWGQLGGAS